MKPSSRSGVDPTEPHWGSFTGASLQSGTMAARLRWVQRLALHACGPIGRIAGPYDRRAFGILMYHRVTPVRAAACPPTLNVRPEQLRRQLAGLLRRGYQPVPLREALACSGSGRLLPSRAFVVTFDDGFENNYTEAWPILRELGVPATIFLATAYLDGEAPFPFDNWAAAGDAEDKPSWRPMTHRQCRELCADPLIDLGAHTHTHQDFRNRPHDFQADLQTNINALSDLFGVRGAGFAFPQGRKGPGFVAPDLVDAARRVGVVCSLTTENDLVRPGDDPFDWGRLSVEDRDTGATIAARLDGWYGAGRDLVCRRP